MLCRPRNYPALILGGRRRREKRKAGPWLVAQGLLCISPGISGGSPSSPHRYDIHLALPIRFGQAICEHREHCVLLRSRSTNAKRGRQKGSLGKKKVVGRTAKKHSYSERRGGCLVLIPASVRSLMHGDLLCVVNARAHAWLSRSVSLRSTRDIRLGHAVVLAGRTRVALRFGEGNGGTPQMDAKKRAELREAVAAARRSLIERRT